MFLNRIESSFAIGFDSLLSACRTTLSCSLLTDKICSVIYSSSVAVTSSSEIAVPTADHTIALRRYSSRYRVKSSVLIIFFKGCTCLSFQLIRIERETGAVKEGLGLRRPEFAVRFFVCDE